MNIPEPSQWAGARRFQAPPCGQRRQGQWVEQGHQDLLRFLGLQGFLGRRAFSCDPNQPRLSSQRAPTDLGLEEQGTGWGTARDSQVPRALGGWGMGAPAAGSK